MGWGKSLIRRFIETFRASLHVFHQTGRDNKPFQREALSAPSGYHILFLWAFVILVLFANLNEIFSIKIIRWLHIFLVIGISLVSIGFIKNLRDGNEDKQHEGKEHKFDEEAV